MQNKCDRPGFQMNQKGFHCERLTQPLDTSHEGSKQLEQEEGDVPVQRKKESNEGDVPVPQKKEGKD